MGSKKSSSNAGSAVLFVLALAAIGAALKFFQENWPIVAVIGGLILVSLIIFSILRSKQPIIYVGNRATKTFHCLSCRMAQEISNNNMMPFRSRETAMRKGYKPCGSCKP